MRIVAAISILIFYCYEEMGVFSFIHGRAGENLRFSLRSSQRLGKRSCSRSNNEKLFFLMA
ncbi:hypothetical protein Hdeb2414_s0001g00015021 [Helianthus debilis subsp. tardiflorus]